MKISDWIQGRKFTDENMDIEEQDDKVIIPAWQFALFVREFYEYRRSNAVYALLLLAVVFLFMFSVTWR